MIPSPLLSAISACIRSAEFHRYLPESQDALIEYVYLKLQKGMKLRTPLQEEIGRVLKEFERLEKLTI